MTFLGFLFICKQLQFCAVSIKTICFWVQTDEQLTPHCIPALPHAFMLRFPDLITEHAPTKLFLSLQTGFWQSSVHIYTGSDRICGESWRWELWQNRQMAKTHTWKHTCPHTFNVHLQQHAFLSSDAQDASSLYVQKGRLREWKEKLKRGL